MNELISVVVSTYERPDALDAVLRGLSRQSDRNFEVVVADDGSGAATAAVIAQWKDRLGVPLAHARHEHAGFRAAEIRNRAIVASKGALLRFPRRRLHSATRISSRGIARSPSPAGSSRAIASCCPKR